MDLQPLTLYSLKVLAVVLTIGSAMIATAANLPDLNLSRQTVAVLLVVQSGISVALLFLPRLQSGPPPSAPIVVAHEPEPPPEGHA